MNMIFDILSIIVPPMLSAIVSIFVCMSNNNKQIAIIETKLDLINKSVEKHNNIVERVYKLEAQVELLEEKI